MKKGGIVDKNMLNNEKILKKRGVYIKIRIFLPEKH